MTRRRSPEFSLDAALSDPGFTPRVNDFPALLDRLAGAEDDAEIATRALARAGLPAATSAMERVEAATPPARARLVDVVGRVAAHDDADALFVFLCHRLSDADARTRKRAAIALGKLHRPGSEVALEAALRAEQAADVRRAMVTALGKVGGERGLGALRDATTGDAKATDADAKARDRAVLMITRTLTRSEPSAFLADRAAKGPTLVSLRCRRGLEAILAGELPEALAPRVADPRFGPRVEATLRGAPEELLVARTMMTLGFPLPVVKVRATDDVGDLVARLLASESAYRVLRHFTGGALRYRLAWAHGGKRRATVWTVAETVAKLRPELSNDPTESTWEAVVYESPGELLIELVPRMDDPRFAYRKADVPAASHPTIAAALVRAAGVRADDVVWDPFCGSGAELCERSFAGPYRALFGTDIDARAIPIARENLAAAGAEAQLIHTDAVAFTPRPAPTLIITNPPMGRRVLRKIDLGALLDHFLEHAAQTLAPGGRLVWMSPLPERTARMASKLGLVLEMTTEVDMGGFSADLQAFTKPESAVPTRKAR